MRRWSLLLCLLGGWLPAEAQAPLAVVNAASFRAGEPVAAGALVSAFGDFAGAPSLDATTVPLPKQLGELRVVVSGTPAALLAVRPTQINFQMPQSAVGMAAVQVTLAGREIARGAVDAGTSSPGIFVLDGLNLAKPGAVLNQDSRVNNEAARARRGEVIQIYATGQGALDPPVDDGAPGGTQPLSVTQKRSRVFIGAEEATVLFSGGSPQFPGLWQINAMLPDATSVSGQMPVFVTLKGVASNPVTIWVE